MLSRCPRPAARSRHKPRVHLRGTKGFHCSLIVCLPTLRRRGVYAARNIGLPGGEASSCQVVAHRWPTLSLEIPGSTPKIEIVVSCKKVTYAIRIIQPFWTCHDRRQFGTERGYAHSISHVERGALHVPSSLPWCSWVHINVVLEVPRFKSHDGDQCSLLCRRVDAVLPERGNDVR